MWRVVKWTHAHSVPISNKKTTTTRLNPRVFFMLFHCSQFDGPMVGRIVTHRKIKAREIHVFLPTQLINIQHKAQKQQYHRFNGTIYNKINRSTHGWNWISIHTPYRKIHSRNADSRTSMVYYFRFFVFATHTLHKKNNILLRRTHYVIEKRFEHRNDLKWGENTTKQYFPRTAQRVDCAEYKRRK